jgi:hypothetical protein
VSLRPWLRFAVLGAALFAAHGLVGRDAPPPAPAGAVLSDDELLFRVALARGYHESDDVVRYRLVRNLRFASGDDGQTVDDAIALGLHESDPVVRRRLVHRMILAVHERVRAREPSATELAAFAAREPARWRQPAHVTLTQHFFADRARAEAADPEDVAASDPLPVPEHLAGHARADLAARLGPQFADAVFAAPLARWSGPVRSTYGYHWIYVHEVHGAQRLSLEEVRTPVREALLIDRQERALRAFVAELREQYGIRAP